VSVCLSVCLSKGDMKQQNQKAARIRRIGPLASFLLRSESIANPCAVCLVCAHVARPIADDGACSPIIGCGWILPRDPSKTTHTHTNKPAASIDPARALTALAPWSSSHPTQDRPISLVVVVLVRSRAIAFIHPSHHPIIAIKPRGWPRAPAARRASSGPRSAAACSVRGWDEGRLVVPLA